VEKKMAGKCRSIYATGQGEREQGKAGQAADGASAGAHQTCLVDEYFADRTRVTLTKTEEYRIPIFMRMILRGTVIHEDDYS
jgi:hypothetical protein